MVSSALILELEKQFSDNPRRVFARLANEYRKSGDVGRAIEMCRAHVPQQPSYISGHIVLGQALYDDGQLDDARRTFEMALSLDPENLIALRQLGDIARLRGDTAIARDWYTRLLDVDPQNTEIIGQIDALDPGTAASTSQPHRTPVAVTGESTDWATESAGEREPTAVATSEAPPSPSGIADDPAAWTGDSDRSGDLRQAIDWPSDTTVLLDDEEPIAPEGAASDAVAEHEPLDLAFNENEVMVDELGYESNAVSTVKVEAELPAFDDALDLSAASLELPSAHEPPAALRVERAEASEFSVGEAATDQDEGSPGDAAEPDDTPAAFVTETMAELYLQQGFRDEALGIYRRLLTLHPDDEALRDRVSRLEAGDTASIDEIRDIELPAPDLDGLELAAEPLVTDSVDAARAWEADIPFAEALGFDTSIDIETGPAIADSSAETAPESLERTAEPVAERPYEPDAEPMPERVAEQTSEPIAEWTSEPVAEWTAEPVTEPTPEPVIEQTPAPVAEATIEPELAGTTLDSDPDVPDAAKEAGGGGTPAASDPAHPSVRGFFAGLAGRRAPARPATHEMDLAHSTPAVPAREAMAVNAMTSEGGPPGVVDPFFGDASAESEDAAAARLASGYGGGFGAGELPGQPARVASNDLSLDHVFREASGGQRGGGNAFSFDAFFAEPESGASAPSEGAPEGREGARGGGGGGGERDGGDETSDLEAFNAWLEGLKR
ncbi:MAG: tetratricopeptide repeat protein [Gemmatimonadota bacterium]|nr:tetratricopeptide repeat protein [Gemmatimonadota bacterium]